MEVFYRNQIGYNHGVSVFNWKKVCLNRFKCRISKNLKSRTLKILFFGRCFIVKFIKLNKHGTNMKTP